MNIGDIARLAGVSRSTVSYVLSGKRPIGEEARRRVLAIMEEQNYRPNASARALAVGSTRTIALVVPPLHDRLTLEQLRFVGAISEAAAERDYDTLLSPTGGSRREAFQRLLAERRVDGVLLMETRTDDDRVTALTEHGMPFVTIGRTRSSDEHSWVDLDYDGLVREAVALLTKSGHRHLGLVNRPKDLLRSHYGPAVRSRDSFRRAVRRFGAVGSHACSEDSDEAAADCLDELLEQDPAITAIVSVNERSLRGLVTAAADRRLVVGRSLALVAVAPDHVASAISPAVTNADVPADQLGREAVAMLINAIDGTATSSQTHLVTTPFTDRGSVAVLRRATAG